MRDRIISSIILVALFALFYILGGIYFIAFTSFAAIFAYKEIAFLKKYPPIVIIIGLVSIISLIILNSKEAVYTLGLSTGSIIFPIVLLTVPTLLPRYQKKYLSSDAFNSITFILLVGLGLASINSFMLTDKHLLLYVVLVCVINDVFAYVVGTLIGKHKFSKISPKKSVEGLIAGVLIGTIGSTLFYLMFVEGNVSVALITTISLVLNISCPLGDLIFSKIKRENDIKDFSKLLPGHGGMLDRLDSIIFTSLVFILLLSIFK